MSPGTAKSNFGKETAIESIPREDVASTNFVQL